MYILIDDRGAPLAIDITGANQHDKWSVDDRVISAVATRPTSEQNLRLDKAYDAADIHELVSRANYQSHVHHRRQRGELLPELVPDDEKHLARRWVVERTLG